MPDVFTATTATVGRVTIGGRATGSIEASFDADWFGVGLTAGESYMVSLLGLTSGAGTLSDPFLNGIYSSTGSLISGTTNDDSELGLDSRVRFTPTTSGNHFISAGAFAG